MYPHELYSFIAERNFEIGGNDLLRVISIEENPQLTRIRFIPETCEYELWDKYGNYYKFKALPYDRTLKRKR